MTDEKITAEDFLSLRMKALEIVALLPADLEAAESIIGVVQDLLLWRGGIPAKNDEGGEHV